MENMENHLRQVGQIIGHVLKMLVMMLIRPLVIVSEILFRSDMGERYCSVINMFLGGILVLIASSPIFNNLLNYSLLKIQTPWSILITGGAVAVYTLRCNRQYQAMVRRYQEGIRWHSYCCGSIRIYEFPAILGIAALLILAGIDGLAILLLISRTLSGYFRSLEAALFYNRVLDLIDQQIEMENLQNAATTRLNPKQTEGYNAVLPAYVSGKFKERYMQTLKSTPSATQPPTTKPAPTAN